jgi:biotin/methionine sulfoxide reductase
MGPLVQFDPSMKQRFPHLAHWGAFTAVVEDGRLIRCEPFAGDSNPSPMLDSIVPLVYSPQRVQKPAVRRSWLRGRSREGRGDEDFVEVTWDQALDLVAGEIARVRAEQGPAGIFCGSYGWSSAGRFHHARTQIRRFHFKGGGGVDQVGNYSWGAAQFLLPHVIGSYTALTGRVTDWPSIVAHGEVFVAFGGLPLRNTQVASGGAGDHMLKGWLEKLVAAGVRIINISPSREDCADFLNAEWIPIRPNTDVALMLALAYELQREGVHDRAFLATHCAGYDHLEAYLLGQTDGSRKTPELSDLYLLLATCTSWRAAFLDGDCTGLHAWAGRPARRRLRVWAWLHERCGESALSGAGPGNAGRAKPGGAEHPGGAPDRHAGASRRSLFVWWRAAQLS